MTNLVDIVLISLIAVTAFSLTRVRNLLASVMLFTIFSLSAAALFVVLDAVDVALTEAAVGAGIMTVLMLAAITVTGPTEKIAARTRRSWIAFSVVVITGAALIYATLDMPSLGDPNAPAHTHVSPRYTEASPEEIGIPNMVTSVLASYRGYDTLGEVMVIFAAGVGVLLLLGSGASSSRRKGAAPTFDSDAAPTFDSDAAPTFDSGVAPTTIATPRASLPPGTSDAGDER